MSDIGLCHLHWEQKEQAKREAFLPSHSRISLKKSDKNLLINGDNLEALKLLSKEYENQIDVIYIDPPYNTKNHKFLYNDTFATHAQWLSFIYPRLLLACGLLREDGVLFISIDDNEAAHLKLLCDEVFGEANFITQFVWQKKNKASYLHKNIAKVSEYVLCYAKNIQKAPMLSIEESKKEKPYPLNFKNNPLKELTFAPQSVEFHMPDCTIKACDMSSAKIQMKLLERLKIKKKRNVNSLKVHGSWRYTQEQIDSFIDDGAVFRVAKVPFRINLIVSQSKRKLMQNLLTKESYKMQTNEDAQRQIIELFGFEAFSKPKPIALIKTLIQSVTHAKRDAIILDFFGGSGTTAHAVMELNAQDTQMRKYILVQSSEPLKPNSIAYEKGYKTIYEIMRRRVLLAIQKQNFIAEDFLEIEILNKP